MTRRYRRPLESKATAITQRFFELSVLFKGLDGALELIGGLLLVFLSPEAIGVALCSLVRCELAEDPPLAQLVIHATQNLTECGSASSYLLIHGLAKLVLVGGLLTGRMWSYPIAIAVFAGFGLFQIYQLYFRYSFLLAAMAFLDVIVVLLIVQEYRIVRLTQKDCRDNSAIEPGMPPHASA